jgi:integrase
VYRLLQNHTYKDVSIQLYKRGESEIWNCRVKLPQQNHVRRSLRTSDEVLALEKAKELAWDLLRRNDEGRALNPRSFGIISTEFIKYVSRQIKRGLYSKDKLDSYSRYIRKYFVPFFKNKRIDRITDNLIKDYYEWRLDYQDESSNVTYTRNNRKVVAKRAVRKVPALTTLKREDSALRQIFEFARERGDIKRDQIPQINAGKILTARIKKEYKKRPGFTLEEWRHLIRVSRSRKANKRLWSSLSTEHKKAGITGINERQLNQRALLHDYILFMGNSGLRTMEAKNLRWCDIENITTRQGRETIKLHLKGKGKTRDTISMPSVRTYLSRIRSRQEEWSIKNNFTVDNDSHVFRDEYGNQMKSFNRGFTQLLKAAGLEKDRHGDKRSAYSLRHMYASFRMLYGDVEVYSLADNMGTSVEMIEKFYGHYRKEMNADRLINS